MDYGVQVYGNYQRGLTGIDAWTILDIESIVGTAWHGSVSAATAELVAPLVGGGGIGWPGALKTIAGNVVTGRAAQVGYNLVSGQPLGQDLLNPLDVGLDIAGGALTALRRTRAARAAEGAVRTRLLSNLEESAAARAQSGFRAWSESANATAARVRGAISAADFIDDEGRLLARHGDAGALLEVPLGREVSVEEGARLSGMPEDMVESALDFSVTNQMDCGFRTCNPMMRDRRHDTLPKDPVDVPHPEKPDVLLHVSSIEEPRFKTNKWGLVEVQLEVSGRLQVYGVVRRPSGEWQLELLNNIVDYNTGNIRPQFKGIQGIPMGPDIDLYFVLQKTDNGYINLGNVGPEDSRLQPLVDAFRDRRQVAPDVSVHPSAIQHGTALGYEDRVKWGPALITTAEGWLFWVEEPYIRSWFNFRRVPFPYKLGRNK